MVTEDDVRRMCLFLLETVGKPRFGLPGFRVKDKLFARIRENPDAPAVWRPCAGEKEPLIAHRQSTIANPVLRPIGLAVYSLSLS